MNKTELCTFGSYFCMGCCIAPRKSPAKRELTSAIKVNTAVFNAAGNAETFAKRENSGETRKCGVCNNQVFIGRKVVCPLHPANNKGIDLRKRKFCEKDYLCPTQEEYNTWNPEIQKKFLSFIKKKKPDWYQYSINIDNGGYLREFRKLQKIKAFIVHWEKQNL
ncbi:hypothetical protein JW851_02905 [Candidatus Woesearchaeota archaeon]|nr:hypothetical protein [Candidatus Woesearchaeota archaeon]